MSSEKLEAAIKSIEAGDKTTAMRILAGIVTTDPKNEIAWFWLSKCVEEDDRKRYCLARALTINPNNLDARQALAQLEPLLQPSVEKPIAITLEPSQQPLPKATTSKIAPQEEVQQTRTRPSSFDQELRRLTSQGWQILSRTDTTAQLKKSREWSKAGLVLFVLVPLLGGCLYFPLFAIAPIGFLFVVIDYLLRKERLLYVTAEQLSRGEISMAKQDSTWKQPLIEGGILILFIILCFGVIALLMNIAAR